MERKVPEKPIRFVLSVGFGVSTADMAWEGTSAIVIAMLHRVVMTKIYARSAAPEIGTSTNSNTVNNTKGAAAYSTNGFSFPKPLSGFLSIKLPTMGSKIAETIFAAKIKNGTATNSAVVSLPAVE